MKRLFSRVRGKLSAVQRRLLRSTKSLLQKGRARSRKLERAPDELLPWWRRKTDAEIDAEIEAGKLRKSTKRTHWEPRRPPPIPPNNRRSDDESDESG